MVTKAYVVCALGVGHIGYVLVCYGAACAFGSFLFGILVKLIGRIPIFLFGSALSFALLLTLAFFWHPDPNHPEIFFIVSGLWGLTYSVWFAQLNGE